MTSEEYGQYIDDFELGADVMPGESLTDYIERRRREFESKADGGSIGIEVLFGPKVPAAPSQLVEESEIVLGYRGDDAARSDRASGRSAGRADSRGGVDRSAVGEGSQYAKNVAAQNNKPSFEKKVKSVVTNPVVQALGGALLTGGINLAAPGALEKLNKARMISNAIKYGKDIAIEDEIESIPQTGGISPYADGGRVGLFMGGPALQGQALNIYNSMNAYGFSDQQIADALSARGLYTPAGSGTTQPEQVTGIIGSQLNQGDDRVIGLQETFTKDLSGDPRFSYLTPQEQANKYRFDRSVEPREGLMGFFDTVGNKFKESRFFQPKIRGTLGTRLANQPRLPLPGAIASYSMSPFNPDSKNYNPDLVDQLNFLELGDDMIGMSSTGLKYGSGSVLRGQNVISGFGSNDYLKQLNRYINRKNITEKARQRGIDERNKFLAEQEAKQKAQLAAQLAIAQKEIAARGYKDYGSGGGLDPSLNDPVTGEYTGASTQDYGSGEKDGGLIGYNKGGLATMFTRRR